MVRSRRLAAAWSAVVVLTVAVGLGASGSASAAAVPASACPENTNVNVRTVSTLDAEGRLSTVETTQSTLVVSLCVSSLTLSPASAAPLASVTATLAGVQPTLCTTELRTVQVHRYVPRFETVPVYEFGVFVGYETVVVGYDDVITTTTTTVVVCVANTAVIRFGGGQVAVATPASNGLTATFAVPSVVPGAYAVTATPDAGNSASASFTVPDTIPPFISGLAAPAPNTAGWYSGDVTVTFACFDVDSGIRSCTGPTTLSGDGAGQSVIGTAVDDAGNSATSTVGGINIDTTAPTITPRASRPPDHDGWYTAPVTISFDCADGLSGVAFCTGPVTLSADGRSVLYTSEVFDYAGNGLAFANTVRIDQTPPTITAPPAIVSATAAGTCTASPALGTPTAADNLGSVAVTHDGPALFPLGTTTVHWTAADPAGHTANATQSVTVNDLARPLVTAPVAVTATATGASGTVIANSSIGNATATDNCPGVGAPSVSGIPAGNLFPIGTTILTWTAPDAAGNVGTATQTVSVSYGLCLLYDATRAARLGSTVPIKFQLCAAGGANLSAASLVPHATGVVRTGAAISSVAEDSGNANPDGDFRYDATLGGTGGYIYNLSTGGLSSGTWEMRFTLGGQAYSVPFQVR
jgi:hypothetical protein